MTGKTIDLKIEGSREGKSLSPELLDVDEIIHLLSHARDFLFPEKSKNRGRVSVSLKEGSAVFSLGVDAATAIQSQALLSNLNTNHNLSILKPKQIEAIEFFQKFVKEHDFVAHWGLAGKQMEGLRMDRRTEWVTPDEIWADEELYITGEIVDIGGKKNPNVHIDTEEFGTLTVTANRVMLGEDDKNRLYKEQQLRIRIKRNLQTGAFQKGSAELIEFIDFKEESPDEYLDRLIAESKAFMDQIEDPDQWLKSIRGYDG